MGDLVELILGDRPGVQARGARLHHHQVGPETSEGLKVDLILIDGRDHVEIDPGAAGTGVLSA